MTADIDVETLRAAAEAATEVRPGPWKVWAMEVLADPLGTSDLDDAVPVAKTALLIDGKPRTHLADFIAYCDPPMVLALLDEVETLRARLAAVEALADEWHPPGAQGHHAWANELRAALEAP